MNAQCKIRTNTKLRRMLQLQAPKLTLLRQILTTLQHNNHDRTLDVVPSAAIVR